MKAKNWIVRVKWGWMMGVHRFSTKREATRFYTKWLAADGSNPANIDKPYKEKPRAES